MPISFHHAILFTGHMIDAPGRTVPRFPASAEPAARAAIRSALGSILATDSGPTLGMAGGGSGGDILFHELCFEFAVPTRLYLALPIGQCRDASVAAAGPDWISRYDSLVARLGPDAIHILDNSTHPDPRLNVWSRTNLWILDVAIATAPKRTLLSLWDGRPGDGPGGTEHLITTAPSRGVDVFTPIPTQPFLTLKT